MSGSQQLLLGTGVSAVAANYIEDVFSTWLYTGNGSTQTITNGIDLSTKGGLVWCKGRSNPYDHYLFDTNRGANNYLVSNGTGAQNPYGTYSNLLTAFNSNGFSLGADSLGSVNVNNVTYASWTFRKQPKFFDVVTYTGNGVSGRNISHSLGSVPGCVIVRNYSTGDNWAVQHRSLTSGTYYLRLNSVAAETDGGGDIFTAFPTSTAFSVGTNNMVNASGQSYVAYLFAHDAGGFGLTGTDNVISCGSFTTNGSGSATVSLGYEPQWIMIKRTDSAGGWPMFDNMRGWTLTESFQLLANSSAAESSFGGGDFFYPTATGFSINAGLPASATYIYIAIRRGPMKTPTTGTSVFMPSTVGATADVTVGFPSDTFWSGQTSSDWRCFDRLRSGFELATNTTAAEGTFNYYPTYIDWDSNSVWNQNLQNAPVTNFWFRRAPGFFDVVCYTGTSVARTINHNLGVVPEMMIVKNRTLDGNWLVYHVAMGNTKYFRMNTSDAVLTATIWNDTTPTSTVFSLGSGGTENGNTYNYVWYGFASCPGVSKVGSYTGTGALQTINCGFTGGARFVLIKRTDSTGDWFVFNSANGISSGNDPYRILNGTTLTSGTNYVDTTSVGFQVTAAAPAGLNASGGTYIFLAVS